MFEESRRSDQLSFVPAHNQSLQASQTRRALWSCRWSVGLYPCHSGRICSLGGPPMLIVRRMCVYGVYTKGTNKPTEATSSVEVYVNFWPKCLAWSIDKTPSNDTKTAYPGWLSYRVYVPKSFIHMRHECVSACSSCATIHTATGFDI